MYIREACVETLEQALQAEKLGADRIELCSRLDLDGLTPEYETLAAAQSQLSIPIRAMIRPRAGNFTYVAHEIDTMKIAIDFCKSLGVEGVVFGLLTIQNGLDISLTTELIAHARPMKTTFHRAIEGTEDIRQEVHRLIQETTIDAILTSGGKDTPLESESILLDLIRICKERELIVCGKITQENLPEIAGQIPSKAYHGKKIVGDLVG